MINSIKKTIAVILMIAMMMSSMGMSALAVSISHYIDIKTSNTKDDKDITYRYIENKTALLMNDSDEYEFQNDTTDDNPIASMSDAEEEIDDASEIDTETNSDAEEEIDDASEIDTETNSDAEEEIDDASEIDTETNSDAEEEIDDVSEIDTATNSDVIEDLDVKERVKEKNNLLGADPHEHKACGVSGDTDCSHTIIGNTHTGILTYEPIGSFTNQREFVDYVNSLSPDTDIYIYLTESLFLEELEASTSIERDIYVCLNGKSFTTEKLNVKIDKSIIFSNCQQTKSNILLKTGATISNYNSIYAYGINKNIEFDNSSATNKTAFLFVGSSAGRDVNLDYMFYDVSIHNTVIRSLDSDNTSVIEFLGLQNYTINLSMEKVDFTAQMDNVNHYSFVHISREEAYNGNRVSLKFKNFSLAVGDDENVQFLNSPGLNQCKTSVDFSGINTFNGFKMDSFDEPTSFIYGSEITVSDGVTRFTNINNSSGGSLFDDCKLSVGEGAVFEISSNLIKFLEGMDQYIFRSEDTNISGELLITNNSFYGAQVIDTNVRAGLFSGARTFSYGSEKIVISNTAIYRSNDGSGEKFNDNMYIYDFYINYNQEPGLNGYMIPNNSKIFNKENSFGTIGLSIITANTTKLNFALCSYWSEIRTNIEDLNSFDDYFILGKAKNDKAFLHRVGSKLYVSIHASHKICGKDENVSCGHSLSSLHDSSFEFITTGDITADSFKTMIEQGDSSSLFYFMQTDLISETILTVTLNADLHLCMFGHTLENVVFKANSNSDVRRNVYICNCNNMPNPTIKSYADSFVCDLGLAVYGLSSNNQIGFDIKSLASFSGKSFGNSNRASIDMYAVRINNQDLNDNFGKFVYNLSSSNNEYQNIDMLLESVTFSDYTTTGLFSRNVYVTNKNTNYDRITVSGNSDLFSISDVGELKFINSNRILYCKATNSKVFLELKVPTTISGGRLQVGYNELRSNIAEGLIHSSSGITIEDGAELRVEYNIIQNNSNMQYLYSASSDDNIIGSLDIRNNRYISDVATDDSINSSLLLPDGVTLSIGSSKILVQNNGAYVLDNSNSSGVGSSLDTLHIYEVYSEMSQIATPIFKLINSSSFNQDNIFNGISFKNNYGFGRIIDNFDYGDSIANMCFIVDNYYYKSHRLAYTNGNVDIKGYTYTIKYHVNNEQNDYFEQTSTSSVVTKFTSNMFTYEGYKFLGWATVSNVVPKSPDYKVDYADGYDEFLYDASEDGKVIDLYGVWFNLNTKYDVGFNMHGHGTQIATISVAYDSLIVGLASPSEPGYSFDGWYRDAGYSSLWNLDSDKVTDHIVLHAKWTEVTYTITLNTDGGKYADNYSVPVSRKYFEAVTLPTSLNIKKEGYTFVGWYEESDFSGNVITDIPANTEGNKVYYLKWSENEYTITLNKNGGTYANGYTEPKNRKYSEAVILPTSENITKTGNIFIGWYDNDSFTGTKVLNIASNSEGNKVFYLKWDPVKYTIVYNTNGGTIASTSVIKKYEEDLTLALPTKHGYAFDGWYSDFALQNPYDGTTDLSDVNGIEVNIYAKWRYSKYRVIYDTSDTSVVGELITQDCTYDILYKAKSTSEFTKANWTNQYYRFVKSEPSGYTPVRTRLYSEQDFINLIAVDGIDLIYEPIFTMISNETTDPGKSEEEHREQTKDNETFVVTYYRNIDETDIASVSIVYPYNQEAFIKKAKEIPFIYEGHKCIGWALGSDKTTIKYHELEEIFYEADANPEANNNINLYAVWGENGYSVVFSRSGLSGVTGDNRTYELTFKEKATSPASTNFTKSNSRFAYYEYASATLDNAAYTYTPKRERIYASREFSELATVSDIVLNYKPHFTTISNNNTNPGKTSEEHSKQTEENETFVITYYANNGTDTKEEVRYRYDTESYIKENEFVYEGYHFMGWTDEPRKTTVVYNEEEEIFFKIENDANNDISLYAVWEENTYKVVWTTDGDTDISGDDRSVELKFTQKGTAPAELAFTKDHSRFAYYEYFKIEPTESTNYKISRERLYKSQEFSGLVDIHNVTLYFKPIFTMISNEDTDPGKSDEEHNKQTEENETFVFTYYANDGTENKKVVTYRYNTLSLTENKIFDRKNYEFIGWNEDKDATSGDDEYQPGRELFKKVENDANNNKELYAIWRKFEYTITFSANGQENVTGADISITSGFEEEKNAPSSTAFARNSDRFAYYEYVSTTVNGETSNVKPKRLRLYANQSYVNLSEVNGAEYLFRAVFTNDGEVDDSDTEEKFKRLHYEIKYHANNGSNNVITQIATYNEATFIQKNDFKRTGYSFKGYSTSQGSSTVAYVDGDEVFVKVEDDRVLNLYAVWKKTGSGGNSGGSGGSSGGGGGGGGGKAPATMIEKVVPSLWIFNNAINKYVVYGADWKILTGWVYTYGINNRVGWHYFTPYGTPMQGWFFDMNNEIYYFGNDFVMVTGNVEIDGMVRKFDVSGALRDNLFTSDNKNVNNKGVWIYDPSVNIWQYWILQENETIALVRSSWFRSNVSGVDTYYAVDKNGTPITGFVKYKGQYFYLQEEGLKIGQLLSDTTIIRNGVSITFDEYGRITNDIRQIENAIKIFDMDANTQTSNFWITNSDATKSYVKSNKYVSGLSNLEKATGVQNIDNYYYSFNPAGQLQFGLQVIDDKLYYAKDYEPRVGSLPLQK